MYMHINGIWSHHRHAACLGLLLAAGANVDALTRGLTATIDNGVSLTPTLPKAAHRATNMQNNGKNLVRSFIPPPNQLGISNLLVAAGAKPVIPTALSTAIPTASKGSHFTNYNIQTAISAASRTENFRENFPLRLAAMMDTCVARKTNNGVRVKHA